VVVLLYLSYTCIYIKKCPYTIDISTHTQHTQNTHCSKNERTRKMMRSLNASLSNKLSHARLMMSILVCVCVLPFCVQVLFGLTASRRQICKRCVCVVACFKVSSLLPMCEGRAMCVARSPGWLVALPVCVGVGGGRESWGGDGQGRDGVCVCVRSLEVLE
jgi:hypothetical protein